MPPEEITITITRAKLGKSEVRASFFAKYAGFVLNNQRYQNEAKAWSAMNTLLRKFRFVGIYPKNSQEHEIFRDMLQNPKKHLNEGTCLPAGDVPDEKTFQAYGLKKLQKMAGELGIDATGDARRVGCRVRTHLIRDLGYQPKVKDDGEYVVPPPVIPPKEELELMGRKELGILLEGLGFDSSGEKENLICRILEIPEPKSKLLLKSEPEEPKGEFDDIGRKKLSKMAKAAELDSIGTKDQLKERLVEHTAKHRKRVIVLSKAELKTIGRKQLGEHLKRFGLSTLGDRDVRLQRLIDNVEIQAPAEPEEPEGEELTCGVCNKEFIVDDERPCRCTDAHIICYACSAGADVCPICAGDKIKQAMKEQNYEVREDEVEEEEEDESARDPGISYGEIKDTSLEKPEEEAPADDESKKEELTQEDLDDPKNAGDEEEGPPVPECFGSETKTNDCQECPVADACASELQGTEEDAADGVSTSEDDDEPEDDPQVWHYTTKTGCPCGANNDNNDLSATPEKGDVNCPICKASLEVDDPKEEESTDEEKTPEEPPESEGPKAPPEEEGALKAKERPDDEKEKLRKKLMRKSFAAVKKLAESEGVYDGGSKKEMICDLLGEPRPEELAVQDNGKKLEGDSSGATNNGFPEPKTEKSDAALKVQKEALIKKLMASGLTRAAAEKEIKKNDDYTMQDSI